jgi:hypothetical protein
MRLFDTTRKKVAVGVGGIALLVVFGLATPTPPEVDEAPVVTLAPTTTTTEAPEPTTTTTTEAPRWSDEYLQAAECLGQYEAASRDKAGWLTGCMAEEARSYSGDLDPIAEWCDGRKWSVLVEEGTSIWDMIQETERCRDQAEKIDYLDDYLDERIRQLLDEGTEAYIEGLEI